MITRTTKVRLVAVVAFVESIAAGARHVSEQAFTFMPVGSIAGPADMVRVQGTLAFIAAGKTLRVVDISNPSVPQPAGSYEFPFRIWGFRVSGTHVYVAADVFGLGILDVSDPAKPTLRGSLKTRGQAKNVSVLETTAFVADHVSGVDIVDVSNPSKPISVGSFFLEGFARDVVASGSLAFAVDVPSGFYVLDARQKGTPEPLSALQSMTGAASVEILEEQPSRGPSTAVAVGGGALQLFDVSNPAAPVRGVTFPTPGGARRVSIKDRMAYVAAGIEGLQVVDLSAPAKPTIVGAYKATGPARDVAVASSVVLLVVGRDVLVLQRAP